MLVVDRDKARTLQVCATCKGTCGREHSACPRCAGRLEAVTPRDFDAMGTPIVTQQQKQEFDI